MDNTSEQKRIEAEANRVEAEEGRVVAEAGRAHAESNDGSGRVEQEMMRQEEFKKFLEDPQHYTTPGAKKYFRRVWVGYAVLSAAIVLGLFLDSRDTNDRIDSIQASRVEITYDNCLETNQRHHNSEDRIEELAEKQKVPLREVLNNENSTPEQKAQAQASLERINASVKNTITIIDALVPNRDCIAYVMDRLGTVPDLTEQGGE